MASKLDYRNLHAQADPQKGDSLLPGIAAGGNFPLNAALPKPAGDDHCISPLEQLKSVFPSYFLTVYPFDVHMHTQGIAGVVQTFNDGQISVLELCVFTHHGDNHPAEAGVDSLHQL